MSENVAFPLALLAFWAFRNTALPKPPPFTRAAVVANFRGVFADPRAKYCFGAVFFEAIFIHGLFPYVGLLLLGIFGLAIPEPFLSRAVKVNEQMVCGA